MKNDPKSAAEVAADLRDILSRVKADRLPLDQAEDSLMAQFAATRPAQGASGICGLRTHD